MAKAKSVLDEKSARDSCICASCPSYVDCAEKAFCYTGAQKSKCIKKEQGCLCPACSVQAAMEYVQVLYCIRGNDAEQSKKKAGV